MYFRDSSATTLECCAENLGIWNAFHAEPIRAVLVEIAFKKGWRNLWLECDFSKSCYLCF